MKYSKIFLFLLIINFNFILQAKTTLQIQDCSATDSAIGDECKSPEGHQGMCMPRNCPEGKKLCCNWKLFNTMNNQEILDLVVNSLEKYWNTFPERRTHWALRLKYALKNKNRIERDFWDFINDIPEATQVETVDTKNIKDGMQMFPTDKACAGLRPLAECKCPDKQAGLCHLTTKPMDNNKENLTSHTLYCNCEG